MTETPYTAKIDCPCGEGRMSLTVTRHPRHPAPHYYVDTRGIIEGSAGVRMVAEALSNIADTIEEDEEEARARAAGVEVADYLLPGDRFEFWPPEDHRNARFPTAPFVVLVAGREHELYFKWDEAPNVFALPLDQLVVPCA
ncbi:hypothetical protein [Pyruvatibacter mobilis]|uniref:hypothetical protein n=1 Tax=Pyruvatibacter mobilis TaxID=1712261 RepID=UPI003BAB52A0